MLKILFVILALILECGAFASANRNVTADVFFSADMSKSWTPPSITDSLVGVADTQTLSNKVISGASNTITAIPVAAIGNGSVLSGSNTGDVTAGSFGSTPNANGFSLTGQALNLQPADATHPGGLLAADWVTFNGKQAAGNYITALTGDISASGPGSSAATLATVNSNVGTFSNATVTVNAKGLITSVSSGSGSTPNVTGTRASPTLITAAGGISFSGGNYFNDAFIAGNGSAISVTANPQIATGSSVGQQLLLIGRSASNTVTLADGNGLSLNGSWVGGADSQLGLIWDGTVWSESFRR